MDRRYLAAWAEFDDSRHVTSRDMGKGAHVYAWPGTNFPPPAELLEVATDYGTDYGPSGSMAFTRQAYDSRSANHCAKPNELGSGSAQVLARAIDARIFDLLKRGCVAVTSPLGEAEILGDTPVTGASSGHPVLLFTSREAQARVGSSARAGLGLAEISPSSAERCHLLPCFFEWPLLSPPPIAQYSKVMLDRVPWLESEPYPVLSVFVPLAFAQELSFTDVTRRSQFVMIQGRTFVRGHIMATHVWDMVGEVAVPRIGFSIALSWMVGRVVSDSVSRLIRPIPPISAVTGAHRSPEALVDLHGTASLEPAVASMGNPSSMISPHHDGRTRFYHSPAYFTHWSWARSVSAAPEGSSPEERGLRATTIIETVREFARIVLAIIPSATLRPAGSQTTGSGHSHSGPRWVGGPGALSDTPPSARAIQPAEMHTATVWLVAGEAYTDAESSLPARLARYRRSYAAAEYDLLVQQRAATDRVSDRISDCVSHDDVLARDPSLRDQCAGLVHELSLHFCVPVYLEDPVDLPASLPAPTDLFPAAGGAAGTIGTAGYALVPLPACRQAWSLVSEPQQLLRSYEVFVDNRVPHVRMRVHVALLSGSGPDSAAFFLSPAEAMRETPAQLALADCISASFLLSLPRNLASGLERWRASIKTLASRLREAPDLRDRDPAPHCQDGLEIAYALAAKTDLAFLMPKALTHAPLVRDPRTAVEVARAFQLLVPSSVVAFSKFIMHGDWTLHSRAHLLSVIPALLLTSSLDAMIPGAVGFRALIDNDLVGHACCVTAKEAKLDLFGRNSEPINAQSLRSKFQVPAVPWVTASGSFLKSLRIPPAEACGDFAASQAVGVVDETGPGGGGDSSSVIAATLASFSRTARLASKDRFTYFLLDFWGHLKGVLPFIERQIGCVDGGFYFLHALLCMHEAASPDALFEPHARNVDDVTAADPAVMRGVRAALRQWKSDSPHCSTSDFFEGTMRFFGSVNRQLLCFMAHSTSVSLCARTEQDVEQVAEILQRPGEAPLPCESTGPDGTCFRTALALRGGSPAAKFLRVWTRFNCQLTNCGRILLSHYDPGHILPQPSDNTVPLWRVPQLVRAADGPQYVAATTARPWDARGGDALRSFCSSLCGSLGHPTAAASGAAGGPSHADGPASASAHAAAVSDDIDALVAAIEGTKVSPSAAGKGRRKKKAAAAAAAAASGGSAGSTSAEVPVAAVSAPAESEAPSLTTQAAAEPPVAQEDGEPATSRPISVHTLRKKLARAEKRAAEENEELAQLRAADHDRFRTLALQGARLRCMQAAGPLNKRLREARQALEELQSSLSSPPQPPQPPTIDVAAARAAVSASLAAARAEQEAVAAQLAHERSLPVTSAAGLESLRRQVAEARGVTASGRAQAEAHVAAVSQQATEYGMSLRAHVETVLAATARDAAAVDDRVAAAKAQLAALRGEREAAAQRVRASAEPQLAALRAAVEQQGKYLQTLWALHPDGGKS